MKYTYESTVVSEEVEWPKKNPKDFSINNVLWTNFRALFVTANIGSDISIRKAYVTEWLAMLIEERKRIKDFPETSYYLTSVDNKISELTVWLDNLKPKTKETTK